MLRCECRRLAARQSEHIAVGVADERSGCIRLGLSRRLVQLLTLN